MAFYDDDEARSQNSGWDPESPLKTSDTISDISLSIIVLCMLNVNMRYFMSSRMEFIMFVKLQAINISILQLTIVARDICVRQPRSLVSWFQRVTCVRSIE